MTIEEIKKELSEEAQYIGEDGNMACIAESKNEALTMFRRRVRQDVGDLESEDINQSEIGIGWLYMSTEKDKEELEDAEWYISYKEKNDNPVFVYVI